MVEIELYISLSW